MTNTGSGPGRLCPWVLEDLYRQLNRRRWVGNDPVAALYDYADPADREVAGLVAACLAYGRVAQIRRSVSRALEPLGERPAARLAKMTDAQIARACAGFRHRFTDGEKLAAVLGGIRRVRREAGSLQDAFLQGIVPENPDVTAAMASLVRQLDPAGVCDHLLPDPARGSACKRLHLYLRWMVRHDDVDPGGWDRADPAWLIVPLDVHMHRLAVYFGLTARAVPSARSAAEVTAAFATIRPDDPVRYDFALTRLAILPAMDPPWHS